MPLRYEGRHVEMEQNQLAIDRWFKRYTTDLTREQQADLKKKYARAKVLDKADQAIYMRAFDISEHYRANWQKTGFKAQLVAPSKAAALKYHEHLKEAVYKPVLWENCLLRKSVPSSFAPNDGETCTVSPRELKAASPVLYDARHLLASGFAVHAFKTSLTPLCSIAWA